VRKMYIEKRLGVREGYWDGIWASSSIEEAIRFCEFDPLRRVFERYFPRSGKILEGGCGLGQYVIYYKRLGYDIHGIDFASETIRRILEYDPTIPVSVGDVERLNFPDNYFDVYYSGGVIEHFEEGPFRALQEAYRVLKPDGILILTVPYINLTRKTEDFLLKLRGNSRKEWKRNGERIGYILTHRYEIENSPFEGLEFFQYLHGKKEIMDVVQKAGFDVISHKGLSIQWGLRDFAIFKWLNDRIGSRRYQSSETKTPSGEKSSSMHKFVEISSWKRFMKRLIVEEDERVVMFKPILSVLQRTCANLLLLICKVYKGGSL